MHYVYVLSLVGYSNTPYSKVGCSKNPEKRQKQLQYCYGGLMSSISAIFSFSDRKDAFSAETAVKRYFKPKRIRRSATEGFCVSASELAEFIRANTIGTELLSGSQ